MASESDLFRRPVRFLILPSLGVVAFLVGVTAYQIGVDPDALRILADLLLMFVTVACCLTAFFGGLIHVGRNHPGIAGGYGAWLATTPWRPGLPLPRGSIGLGRRDIALAVGLSITAAAAISLTKSGAPLLGVAPLFLMPLGAAIAYCLANWSCNQRGHVYLVAAASAVIGWVAPSWVCAMVLPLLAYIVGLVGAQAAMHTFPWPDAEEPIGRRLGWPYGRLLTEPDELRTTASTAALHALLAAAVVGAVGSHIRFPPDEASDAPGMALALIFFASFFAMMYRLGKHGPTICPRMCWGERVGARRWIVPRHDAIFAAAIITLAAGPLVAMIALVAGMPAHVVGAAGAGAVVFATLGLGPRVVELHYTGRHQIAHRPFAATVKSGKDTYIKVTA